MRTRAANVSFVWVQVTKHDGNYQCSCKAFRLLAGSDAHQCLHTVHVRDHAPDAAFAEPHEVVTIRSRLPNSLPVAYWVEDAFVTQPNATNDVLNCSHDSHRSRCEHVTAGRVHLDGFCPELGIDDADDLNAAEVASALALNSMLPQSSLHRYSPLYSPLHSLSPVSLLPACTGSGCL